jgi:hypothetical protein
VDRIIRVVFEWSQRKCCRSIRAALSDIVRSRAMGLAASTFLVGAQLGRRPVGPALAG